MELVPEDELEASGPNTVVDRRAKKVALVHISP